MAVTRITIGHTTRRDKLGAVILILSVMAGVFLGNSVLGPLEYERQMSRLDLSPGSIGSPADHSAPEVHTLAEMESNDRFILVNEERGDWQSSTGALIGGVYYNKITLADGTIVAARINYDAQQINYIQDEYDSVTIWTEDHWMATYPIGTLRPWPEGVEAEVSAADWFTYKAAYADMEGDFAEELPDKGAICDSARLRCAAIGMALGTVLIVVELCLGDRKERKASTPRNDLELWILATYANWAQFFNQLNYKGRLTAPNTPRSPLYFGGRLKDHDSKKFTISTLKDSWGIKNREDLLETVDYMSRGPGLQNCATQADRAWELCRSTQLLGMGYVAGWLTREEMIDYSCPVCQTIQRAFQSWDELSESYLEGCIQWTLQEGLPLSRADMRRQIHENLTKRPDSPYKVAWDLPLDPEYWARRKELER